MTIEALTIDLIEKNIAYHIAEHENTYHLDNDVKHLSSAKQSNECTPVKERKELEEAERAFFLCLYK